jgi:hypothetical protein
MMNPFNPNDFLHGDLNLDFADDFYDYSKDNLIICESTKSGTQAAPRDNHIPKTNITKEQPADKRKYTRTARPPQEPGIIERALPKDVVCARGRGFYKNEGNKIFTRTIRENLERYRSAGSRKRKSEVVSSIVKAILATGARFVRYDKKTQTWKELPRTRCHEKVSVSFVPSDVSRGRPYVLALVFFTNLFSFIFVISPVAARPPRSY